MSCDEHNEYKFATSLGHVIPPTQITLYECISLLVRWFFVNTPKWAFGHDGSSDDVICRNMKFTNETIKDCKVFIDSLVYQRTDIFITTCVTTCVCVIAFMTPHIFKKYNKTIKDNNQRIIHAFACTVVSLVSMEGVKDSSVVDSIKQELNKMDKVVSRKIGKKCSSYHILDFISFMNSDAVDAIMQRSLEEMREEE